MLKLGLGHLAGWLSNRFFTQTHGVPHKPSPPFASDQARACRQQNVWFQDACSVARSSLAALQGGMSFLRDAVNGWVTWESPRPKPKIGDGGQKTQALHPPAFEKTEDGRVYSVDCDALCFNDTWFGRSSKESVKIEAKDEDWECIPDSEINGCGFYVSDSAKEAMQRYLKDQFTDLFKNPYQYGFEAVALGNTQYHIAKQFISDHNRLTLEICDETTKVSYTNRGIQENLCDQNRTLAHLLGICDHDKTRFEKLVCIVNQTFENQLICGYLMNSEIEQEKYLHIDNTDIPVAYTVQKRLLRISKKEGSSSVDLSSRFKCKLSPLSSTELELEYFDRLDRDASYVEFELTASIDRFDNFFNVHVNVVDSKVELKSAVELNPAI